MKVGILAITEGGRKLAEKLAGELETAEFLAVDGGIARTLVKVWQRYDAFICIMATGIVVRTIAPLIKDKATDPCVLVMDEQGQHVISLLSGHLGGGNELAKLVAHLIGGTAVITTASDVLGLTSLDLWLREQQLVIENKEHLTGTSARLVNKGYLRLYFEGGVDDALPEGLVLADRSENADIIVSNTTGWPDDVLLCRPKNLVVGVGCNRGAQVNEFEKALADLFTEVQLSPLSIRNLASIDLKKDEDGLLAFAADRGWQIDFFDKHQLNSVEGVTISPAAMKAVGAAGVAEPAALLSAQSNELLVRKRKWQNITMAVARASCTLSEPAPVQ